MKQLDLFGKHDAMEYAVSLNTSELYHLSEQNAILYHKVRELRREAAIKRCNAVLKMRQMSRKAEQQVHRAMSIAKVNEFSWYLRD